MLLVTLSVMIMAPMVIVFILAFMKCFELLQIKERVNDMCGDSVIAQIEDEACLFPTEPGKSMQAKSVEEKWMGYLNRVIITAGSLCERRPKRVLLPAVCMFSQEICLFCFPRR